MRKKYLSISSLIILSLSLIILKFTGQQGQTCVEYTNSFTENFSTKDYKDEDKTHINLKSWPPAPVLLSYLGANFDITKPAGMGGHIYICAAADFNGDGYPDLVGLELTGPSGSYQATSRLVIAYNIYPTSGGSDQIFKIDTVNIIDTFNTWTGPASIVAGDFNGDGLIDFFFAKNSADEFGYTNFVAVMYINVGTKTSPKFNPRNMSPNLDFTSKFQAAGIYLNWTANHFAAVDIDKDGDLDILAASQDKIFLARNPGPTNFNLASWTVAELNYDQRTGYKAPVPLGTNGQSYPDRGTSAVAAGDFDGDGDIDIVCGSVNNWPFLVYYQNDGTGHFLRSEIPIPISSCTGTVALCVSDFKLDGRPDIFGATDAWNAGNQAHMWIFKNQGQTPTTTTITDQYGNTITTTLYEMNWSFLCLNQCNPIIPPYYDVDMTTMLDYDQDGDMDLILADANHSGDYYLVINTLANVYALHGEAVSKTISQNLDPRQYAITKVQITNLQQGVRGTATGLSVSYYVSNDGGQNWELYQTFTGTNIKNYGSLPVHTFDHFGGDLRWKAVLDAPNDNITDYPGGASYDTPLIYSITFNYTYIERREYSRSSVATEVIDRFGTNHKLIIASSFVYPGWEGHLRAYDVTGMTAVQNSSSTLRTVTSSDLTSDTGRWIAQGVELLWDAGELLNSRSPDSRTIYAGYRSSSNSPLTRIDFSINNLTTLAPLLQDKQNDNAGLIQFIRGQDRYWKLGDINHSTPVVVGPPSGDPIIMGSGYADFKSALSDRKKVVYVGANDGMIHCFDATTGDELWGYIPYNLLGRLRNMYAYDSTLKIRYYQHDVYVDSSPSVSDVYINGQWKTVLVCGQGAGNGQAPTLNLGKNQSYGNKNTYYYFALDITDPANPRPLWEFYGNLISGQGQQNKIYFTTNGQTWSVPAIGKINLNGTPTWVAFMGSGYAGPGDEGNSDYIGNSFCVVNIADGSLIKSYQIANVDSSSSKNSGNPFADIKNSLPGSPSTIDTDKDSNYYINYAYFGDLDGRLWRLDVSSGNINSWSLKAIYTDRCLYPIITKPAIYLGYSTTGSNYPRVYFGTGGDERAPADRLYSFVALVDDGKTTGTSAVEWYVGDPTETGIPSNKSSGTLTAGEKVWADPVIANYIVYFSTLKGSIEAADPCQNLNGEAGRLYARYIQPMYGQAIGTSALKNAQGQATEYLALASKARTAVTVGERERAGGGYKQDVYVQEYNSTIEKLEQPVGALLRIKSWREIYQIIR
ncbi:MAG TPA: hypothetical protein ENO29_07135 [Candidatus Aminicenantes bacterium]|nr:MAG: hypothetical protein C0168_07410 [Candidatus Aminicenantes bacterium]HEK86111.1 hypothetical protein [Candidatus Aminicenantes bacterium]